MPRRPFLSAVATRYVVIAVGLAILAADAHAQLIGRRLLRRDNERLDDYYESMEEYYDEMEDYYEDRDPRMARDAERMENYYEDLRKGRAGAPPLVNLPGVRVLVEPRLRGDDRPLPPDAPPPYAESPYAESPHSEPPYSEPPMRSRWQPWGASRPDNGAELTPVPAQPQPPAAATQPPAAATQPTPADSEASVLRFPTQDSVTSAQQLARSHAAFEQQLKRLSTGHPESTEQWLAYLALPSGDSAEFAGDNYYNTTAGRKQLAEALEHYDRVASDPQYRDIARLPAFGETRGALRETLAGLDQQPTLADPNGEPQLSGAEELPTPPAD